MKRDKQLVKFCQFRFDLIKPKKLSKSCDKPMNREKNKNSEDLSNFKLYKIYSENFNLLNFYNEVKHFKKHRYLSFLNKYNPDRKLNRPCITSKEINKMNSLKLKFEVKLKPKFRNASICQSMNLPQIFPSINNGFYPENQFKYSNKLRFQFRKSKLIDPNKQESEFRKYMQSQAQRKHCTLVNKSKLHSMLSCYQDPF